MQSTAFFDQHRYPAGNGSSFNHRDTEASLADSMGRLNLLPAENTATEMPSSMGSYPERPGEPDCPHYMRTGYCRFDTNCHFNHPPRNVQVLSNNQSQDVLPERIGEPECQYYMRTGICKFGITCKFHHPRSNLNYNNEGQLQLNFLGLPMRPGQKECSYYLRMGSCKYGLSCKYHHPQPTAMGGMMPTTPSSPLYTSATGTQPIGDSSWQLGRGPYIPASGMQSPSNYMRNVSSPTYPTHGWDAYKSMQQAEGQQQPVYSYGVGRQPSQPASTGFNGMPTTGSDSLFPERRGQPECPYYMKTGDCKFRSNCKFHHPKDRISPSMQSLSVVGLPLRPDQPPCAYYVKNGICKFGPMCRFNHPVGSGFQDADSALGYENPTS